MNDIKTYIILFFTYSFIGWVFEVIYSVIVNKKIINRGFLIGPYCPIYGCGGLLISLFLKNIIVKPVIFFFSAVFICAILEYCTSYVLEKVFKVRWWDYSNDILNLNGRICLWALVSFGIMSCVEVYLLNPFMLEFISSIPNTVLNIVVYILITIFVIDNIVSWEVIFKIKIVTNGIKDNTEEITNAVKEVIISKYKSAKRIIHAFPDMRVIKEKIKEKLK